MSKKLLRTFLVVCGLGVLFLYGQAQAAWKFGVIGDTRSGDSAHSKNVQGIINKMPNGQRVTILNSGDITPDGNDSQWQNWQEIVTPLNIDWSKDHPPQYIGAVGNHDAHESGWQDRWARYLPAQVGRSAYLDIPADSRGLYGSARYDNALFIWIDSESLPAGQETFLENTLKKAAQDSAITWKFVFFHRGQTMA
jgi:hypothetical protein